MRRSSQWVNVSYAVFRKSHRRLSGRSDSRQRPVVRFRWTAARPITAATSSCSLTRWHHRWILFQPVFVRRMRAALPSLPHRTHWAPTIVTRSPRLPASRIIPSSASSLTPFTSRRTSSTTPAPHILEPSPARITCVKMLAGDPTAEQVCTLDDSNGTLFDDSMLPADLDTP